MSSRNSRTVILQCSHPECSNLLIKSPSNVNKRNFCRPDPDHVYVGLKSTNVSGQIEVPCSRENCLEVLVRFPSEFYGENSYCSPLCRDLDQTTRVTVFCNYPDCSQKLERILSEVEGLNFCQDHRYKGIPLFKEMGIVPRQVVTEVQKDNLRQKANERYAIGDVQKKISAKLIGRPTGRTTKYFIGKSHTQKTKDQMSESARASWASGTRKLQASVSQVELSLKPYLTPLGFKHRQRQKSTNSGLYKPFRKEDYRTLVPLLAPRLHPS